MRKIITLWMLLALIPVSASGMDWSEATEMPTAVVCLPSGYELRPNWEAGRFLIVKEKYAWDSDLVMRRAFLAYIYNDSETALRDMESADIIFSIEPITIEEAGISGMAGIQYLALYVFGLIIFAGVTAVILIASRKFRTWFKYDRGGWPPVALMLIPAIPPGLIWAIGQLFK